MAYVHHNTATKGRQAGQLTAEGRHRGAHALQHGGRHVGADVAHRLAGR